MPKSNFKNEAVTEGMRLQLLLKNIREMQVIHAAGRTCCDKLKEWNNRTYGWHNPLFPPEYRSCCLKGADFEADPSCDLYYFMAYYYESITGQKAPHNFELDGMWKTRLLVYFPVWGPTYQEAVLGIVANCTRWKRRRRIQDAGKLLKTEEMKVLTEINC